ncbi:hypothetical protein ACIA48_03820 [Mycobacterium sp. NPDC051804]|uniref:hypothetical protein n=1 Tax=Mycobacterium sp. NPDC051804 TaxID=3364295 RepID=UPI00378821E4
MTRDDEPNWQDQRSLVIWAGVAMLLLLAILLYAVSCTADESRVPETLPTAPSSSATPSTYTTSSTTTTSYSVPSVETSEDNPRGPVPGPVPAPG